MKVVLLAVLVVMVVILAGASASAVPDSGTPSADSTPDDDTIACQIESSSSGSIAITMYAMDNESEPHTDTATDTLRARTSGDE